jgi:hypothetical protein
MPKGLSIKSITFAVLLVASINLGWSFYLMHLDSLEREQAYKHGVILCTLGAYSDVRFRIYIELSLLVAFVGSWVKGFKSALISMVGVGGATLFYVLWWQLYFKLAAIASPSDLEFTRHVAYLDQGNYLDLAIAASIGLIISLQLRRAALSLFRPTKPCS